MKTIHSEEDPGVEYKHIATHFNGNPYGTGGEGPQLIDLRVVEETDFDNTNRLYCLLEAVEWTCSFLARERARPALRDFDLLGLTKTEGGIAASEPPAGKMSFDFPPSPSTMSSVRN